MNRATMRVVLLLPAVLAGTGAAAPLPGDPGPLAGTSAPTASSVPSADGAAIAYSASGAGETALVFIHCGFCDHTFWRHQMESFAADYRVIALDLAGHGASGRDRKEWTLAAFGEDVRAVADALGLERMVLVGSSLGGPVALEAARLLPGRVAGVVAADTLHDADRAIDPEAWRARNEAFRRDFAGACTAMVAGLFHEDADPSLRAQVEHTMCDPRGEALVPMLDAFAGYDMAAAMRAAGVPIRGINGDLYPTDLEANRRVAPGFDAAVMEGVGHFPMLERPEAFDRHLKRWLEELLGRGVE